MAEGAGLLNQYAGNRIEGSNPSPSANYLCMAEHGIPLYRDTLDASPLSAILNILRQTLESSELEERLCHLESLMDEKRDHKNTSEAAEVPRDQGPCLQGAGGSERNL